MIQMTLWWVCSNFGSLIWSIRRNTFRGVAFSCRMRDRSAPILTLDSSHAMKGKLFISFTDRKRDGDAKHCFDGRHIASHFLIDAPGQSNSGSRIIADELARTQTISSAKMKRRKYPEPLSGACIE
jgi:hypothetical protein